MTIRKFGEFGVAVDRPANLRLLMSDRAVAAAYIESLSHLNTKGAPDLHFTVGQGSLAQCLGIADRGDQPTIRAMTRVSIDVIKLQYRQEHSSETHNLIVAGNAVLQKKGLVSSFLFVSNSGIWRNRDLLPRAHPNDGQFDVLEISSKITGRQLAQAWYRAKSGTHLPHPCLTASRQQQYTWSGDPCRLVADDVVYRGVTWVQFTAICDAFTLYF